MPATMAVSAVEPNTRPSGPASTTMPARENISGTVKARRPWAVVRRTAGMSWRVMARASRLNSTVARESTNTECGSTAISMAML